MKIIRRIEIATILVVALNLIFEFLFHISIKIIPKFFIVSLCTVVLFLMLLATQNPKNAKMRNNSELA